MPIEDDTIPTDHNVEGVAMSRKRPSPGLAALNSTFLLVGSTVSSQGHLFCIVA